MRVLGVDLGKARIGVAILESEFEVVTPREPLQAQGSLAKDARQVADAATKEEAQRIAVGVPISDEDSRMASVCRRFADELRKLDWEVDEVDESLSSHEADLALKEAGLKASQRASRRDSEAACVILERWIAEHAQAS